MKINKFLPFAILFFFVNSFGLSYGLTYTAILTPFFYYWFVLHTRVEPVLPFLALLTPFVIAHFLQPIDSSVYFVSLLNLMTVYIFCCAVTVFIQTNHSIDYIFNKLLKINFIFCLIALALYFTPLSSLVWIEQYLTEGFSDFKRLKMFTYEASHYATLFIPIFFYFFLQLMLRQNQIPFFRLTVMIFLPLLMSFSLGVIAAAGLSVVITYLAYGQTLTRKKRIFRFISAGIFLTITSLVLLFIFFPSNPLFVRMVNVFSGVDASGNGRTVEAFILADKLLDLSDPWWGVGLGQIKLMGADTIRDFYQYDMDYVISIPNATAETLAIFGWVGMILRLGIEIFLYFYTQVWRNYYRMLLFFFVFIYQFTGSYITNLAEYIIWIFAFSKTFDQFHVRQVAPSHPLPDSSK